MKCYKIAAGALNQTPLDWEGNYTRIVDIIQEAVKQGVEILCLPELCLTGYGCEDAFLAGDVQARALDMLARIARVSPITVCVGLPVVYRNALYNCTAVLHGGFILGLVAKQHLAGDGIHYEPRWFKPWPANKRGAVTFRVDGVEQYLTQDIPIGDLCFDLQGVRIGFEICEDAWVAERPGSHLARRGVDIIMNPSASHFAFGKQDVRKRFVIEGSRAFAATYVYANLLGNEAGRAIYDGECLIATGGKLLSQGPRFLMGDSALTTAVVDLDLTRTQQIATASFSPEFDNACWVTSPAGPSLSREVLGYENLAGKTSREAEFSDAVSLALFDYLRKSRSKGFVISLSGGADSAACAYLVHTMIGRGLKELGVDEFCKRVGFPFSTEEGSFNLETVAKFIHHKLLTCVYQSTKNSSETTLEAAKAVAQDTGAKFVVLDVDKVVEAFTSLVAVGLQYEFDWAKDDIALQNIQARTRAPGVWMIANIENKLLITTSNRSEAAVGYCTMDGDTAGSIAPLGGIDKAFLLKWLQALHERVDLLPISKEGLRQVLVQAPTAELRPGESQTDERDLMPYTVLEYIVDRALLDRMPPRGVYHTLKATLERSIGNVPDTSPKVVFGYVEKFYRLWCRNQWKRERYALSFHVDDKNLDPRSWCRFPVLSGGYEVELQELKKELGL